MGCKLSKVFNPMKIAKKNKTTKTNGTKESANNQSRLVNDSLKLRKPPSPESNHSSKSEDAVTQQCHTPNHAENGGQGVADTYNDERVEKTETVPKFISDVDNEFDEDQIIFDDDAILDYYGNEDESNDEEFQTSNAHHIKVRPMATKGYKITKENSPTVLRIQEVNKDIENVISPQSSAINTRDKKFSPKAAKEIRTPCFPTDRCRTPVGMVMPTYGRHGCSQKGLAVYQAHCLNEWMRRQKEKEEDSQE